MRKLFYYLLYLIFVILILPYIVSTLLYREETIYSFYEDSVFDDMTAPIIVLENNNRAYIPLEEYIIGVVAAEMPALFEIEALKAQAVCARTYAYRVLQNNNNADISEIYQAYLTEEEMRKRWGTDFDTYYEKIKSAVKETENEIIKYNGEAIEAVFHAISGGITEASENIWQQPRPYLVSVDSSFDEKTEGFLTEYVFSYEEVQEKLRPVLTYDWDIFIDGITGIDKSDSGYILSLQLGQNVVTGSDFRFALGLRSSNFDIEMVNGQVYIVSRGYGHGVGMSQTGANYLAAQGYSYRDIILYYYKDVYIDFIA